MANNVSESTEQSDKVQTAEINSAKGIWDRVDKTQLEKISEALKLCSAVSICLGFIYVFAYCSSAGLPVPLSFSELPVLLLSVAVVATGLSIIILGFLVFPSAGSAGLLGSSWNEFGGLIMNKIGKPSWLKTYACVGVPIAASILGVVFSSRQNHSGVDTGLSSIAAIIAVAFVIGLPWLLNRNLDESHRLSAFKCFDGMFPVLTLGFGWCLLLVALLLALSSKIEMHLNIQWYVVLPVAVLIVTALFALLVQPRVDQIKRMVYRRVAMALMTVMFAVSILVYPGASWFGAEALRLLNLGGGAEIRVVTKDPKDIPSELANQRLQLLLIAGNDLWMSLVSEQNKDVSHAVFRLSRDNVTSLVFMKPETAKQSQK